MKHAIKTKPKISSTYGLHLDYFGKWIKRRCYVSPEGSRERAVISKDVGNFFICVVVIGVLFFKEAYDVSLAPLLNGKAPKSVEKRCHFILQRNSQCFIDTVCVFDTHIHRINLLRGVHLFHWVDLLLADEVSNGRHRPLTPVLPLHHHPIAEQLQRRILGDAVPLGYVRYVEAEEKLSKEGQIN